MLPENWDAVMVFQHCKPHWITGMHKPIYVGISALEIEACARLLQVPPHTYPDLTACIAVLEQATREARNESA